MRSIIRFLVLIVCLQWLPSVEAATCRDPAGFEAWLAGFKSEAAANGISSSAIGALDGVSYDPGIVAKDHGQHVFRQSFEQFSGRMVNSYRLHKGQVLMKQYAATFARIEQTYGVPAPVIVAIWGLKTDFGAVSGNTPTLRALATLAYDCRRSDMFQAELMDALRLSAATCRKARAAPGPAKSARPNSCLRPILSSRSISTVAAAAIWFTACPTFWPRPLISFGATAGNVAVPGRQDRPISRSSRNGTRPTSMRGRSPISL